MADLAEKNGQIIDSRKLSVALGVPVFSTVASDGEGIAELKKQMLDCAGQQFNPGKTKILCDLAPALEKEVGELAQLPALRRHPAMARAEALLLLAGDAAPVRSEAEYPAEALEAVAAARKRLEASGVDWRGGVIEARYARLSAIQQSVVTETFGRPETLSDKLDRVVTHKFWGMLIFVGVMALMFLSIFTFAQWPMDLFERTFLLGRRCGGGSRCRGGDLESLLENGVVWRRRRGRGVFAADLPAVLFHRPAGRHRLHGPRRVFDGPVDEQSRPARQEFHPDAQFIRLRHSRHHGHAHHRDRQRTGW